MNGTQIQKAAQKIERPFYKLKLATYLAAKKSFTLSLWMIDSLKV